MKILLLFSLILTTGLMANDKEIQHLLSYVKNTECKYIRNGSSHNGHKAVKHIQRKYDYFKDDIKTTEDFIRLSATKSTMSSSPYYIECKNKQKVESSKWLLEELVRFRQLQQKI
ncbi:MAG: DUF5329 family protein [Campylobacterota bacterium]|nr:DUF5329 family protein [Campylobacterota bacterium]